MNNLTTYLANIKDPAHQACFKNVLTWIDNQFPQLTLEMRYNQPMFTVHKTYIIGLSAATAHYAIGVERSSEMKVIQAEIERLQLSCGKKVIRIPYELPLPTELLQTLITARLKTKANCHNFWMPSPYH
ncbi:hypothetical protein B808_5 [Fructilactobacillus florum 8D]|uniref:YdhG-like domain-containing protein n=1 Tax=Fructilactobacillus florum 8D TaxID=1221538 RepID=W9EG76_9LACO|nr:DUF1801 domain-containing protein [Fructilactobacillus florum]EKK20371.1 hypothetical protein B807_864 [Fructilactobacillus florum 2F]ETO41067.1 hypothetical protein B808_5 [Fructilactobacillus florum 8D]